MEPDFSGYATKADTLCTDGRTITDSAFAHQDTLTVPLVWQHQHDSPDNILGHVVLEHRDSSHPEGAGTYCRGYFNPELPNAITTKALVHNKDVKSLSIYATGLVEKVRGKAREVLHGAIQEVSVVISGANPGAFIDNLTFRHSDGTKDTDLEEAYIYNGLNIELPESVLAHADAAAESSTETPPAPPAAAPVEDEDETVLDVYETMTEKQKNATHLMIGAALEENLQTGGEAAQANTTGGTLTGDASSTNTPEAEGTLAHQEGSTMTDTRNAFEHNGSTATGGSMTGTDSSKHRLTHSQLVDIVKDAKQPGRTFKDAVLAHAETYGINDINLLFPDAQALTQTPEWISRRMEWVSVVLNGTKHSPFAKVKTLLADITAPEARAKGYVTGARKLEEVFGLLKRTTSPTTVYKKQKLDRDDMLDITDINVVNWLKAEMRLMIEEELARAILVGDNRSAMSPDKIKDPAGSTDGEGIRSVRLDDDLYSIKVPLAANVSPKDSVKAIVRAMNGYKGSGSPTCFISRAELTEMMLEEDKFGRPLYENRAALADKMGVGRIETVDLFSEYEGLFAIIVSLSDYTVGTNRGGELTSFEDFDIDFNQYKYLQESRLSGGLTKPFSALVVTKAQGTQATVVQPSYDGATKVITIPAASATPGVVFMVNDVELEPGAQDPIEEDTIVEAFPLPGFYIPAGTTRNWSYAV